MKKHRKVEINIEIEIELNIEMMMMMMVMTMMMIIFVRGATGFAAADSQGQLADTVVVGLRIRSNLAATIQRRRLSPPTRRRRTCWSRGRPLHNRYPS